MGYKLAGFNMLGGVEIDPEMMAIYRANHKPKHSYRSECSNSTSCRWMTCRMS